MQPNRALLQDTLQLRSPFWVSITRIESALDTARGRVQAGALDEVSQRLERERRLNEVYAKELDVSQARGDSLEQCLTESTDRERLAVTRYIFSAFVFFPPLHYILVVCRQVNKRRN